MSRMTRKQVADLVDDDTNWTIIPGNNYIKLGVLSYGSLMYACIFAREICNTFDILTRHAQPKYSWRRTLYYEYDPAGKGLKYSTSNTQIKDKIYEEAKKNGDNKIQD